MSTSPACLPLHDAGMRLRQAPWPDNRGHPVQSQPLGPRKTSRAAPLSRTHISSPTSAPSTVDQARNDAVERIDFSLLELLPPSPGGGAPAFGDRGHV